VTERAVIRAAHSGDTGDLGRLGALLVREHYEFDPRRFLEPTSQTAERYGAFLASQVDGADAVLLVADLETQVIGYAFGTIEGYDYMSLRGPAAVLHDVIVHPGHRGRGLGRELLKAMIDAFKTRGAPRVVLSTAERNASAQRFFDREGFRRTMVEMTRDF
jgi:ribosomal protein S18 acetylase RimI-like enzyme